MVGIKTRRAAQPTVTEAAPTVPPPPFRDRNVTGKYSSDELAEILKDVVDFLFPRVPPPEAAVYLYLLRRSIFETGAPYVRLSEAEMTKNAVGSPHRRPRKESKSKTVSDRTVRKALMALETLGAIHKESAPGRGGTVYRVFLPDEISACRAAKRAREAAAETRPAPQVDEKREVDFYNVRANRVRIFERDGYACRYCARRLTRHTATLDHVVPVSAGGGHGWDNLVTACLECNSSKTGRAVGDFLAERCSVPP